jgi:fumarate reductase subunit D
LSIIIKIKINLTYFDVLEPDYNNQVYHLSINFIGCLFFMKIINQSLIEAIKEIKRNMHNFEAIFSDCASNTVKNDKI